MELAEATYPDRYQGNVTERLQGLSLKPTFENRSLDRDVLYFEMNGNRAIRTEKWKAVARAGLRSDLRYQVALPIEHWELYDMEKDRTEINNLAAERPDVLRKMVQQWESWIQTP